MQGVGRSPRTSTAQAVQQVEDMTPRIPTSPSTNATIRKAPRDAGRSHVTPVTNGKPCRPALSTEPSPSPTSGPSAQADLCDASQRREENTTEDVQSPDPKDTRTLAFAGGDAEGDATMPQGPAPSREPTGQADSDTDSSSGDDSSDSDDSDSDSSDEDEEDSQNTRDVVDTLYSSGELSADIDSRLMDAPLNQWREDVAKMLNKDARSNHYLLSAVEALRFRTEIPVVTIRKTIASRKRNIKQVLRPPPLSIEHILSHFNPAKLHSPIALTSSMLMEQDNAQKNTTEASQRGAVGAQQRQPDSEQQQQQGVTSTSDGGSGPERGDESPAHTTPSSTSKEVSSGQQPMPPTRGGDSDTPMASAHTSGPETQSQEVDQMDTGADTEGMGANASAAAAATTTTTTVAAAASVNGTKGSSGHRGVENTVASTVQDGTPWATNGLAVQSSTRELQGSETARTDRGAILPSGSRGEGTVVEEGGRRAGARREGDAADEEQEQRPSTAADANERRRTQHSGGGHNDKDRLTERGKSRSPDKGSGRHGAGRDGSRRRSSRGGGRDRRREHEQDRGTNGERRTTVNRREGSSTERRGRYRDRDRSRGRSRDTSRDRSRGRSRDTSREGGKDREKGRGGGRSKDTSRERGGARDSKARRSSRRRCDDDNSAETAEDVRDRSRDRRKDQDSKDGRRAREENGGHRRSTRDGGERRRTPDSTAEQRGGRNHRRDSRAGESRRSRATGRYVRDDDAVGSGRERRSSHDRHRVSIIRASSRMCGRDGDDDGSRHQVKRRSPSPPSQSASDQHSSRRNATTVADAAPAGKMRSANAIPTASGSSASPKRPAFGRSPNKRAASDASRQEEQQQKPGQGRGLDDAARAVKRAKVEDMSTQALRERGRELKHKGQALQSDPLQRNCYGCLASIYFARAVRVDEVSKANPQGRRRVYSMTRAFLQHTLRECTRADHASLRAVVLCVQAIVDSWNFEDHIPFVKQTTNSLLSFFKHRAPRTQPPPATATTSSGDRRAHGPQPHAQPQQNQLRPQHHPPQQQQPSPHGLPPGRSPGTFGGSGNSSSSSSGGGGGGGGGTGGGSMLTNGQSSASPTSSTGSVSANGASPYMDRASPALGAGRADVTLGAEQARRLQRMLGFESQRLAALDDWRTTQVMASDASMGLNEHARKAITEAGELSHALRNWSAVFAALEAAVEATLQDASAHPSSLSSPSSASGSCPLPQEQASGERERVRKHGHKPEKQSK